ncbi:4-hydroxyphenylpyruvate dioxygenase-like protein [Trichomycterus rosablanca]|uniref:4-hydroxyphenylpyruvate dioxygenase-like protein n=1 Tax=Trichomycterus rosablanca TaxID=2290929 RepID=UPI002F3540F6
MAAYLSRLHHISLHVSNVEKIAHDLVNKFQFDLFAARLCADVRQLAFRKGSAVFVVSERAAEQQQQHRRHRGHPDGTLHGDDVTAGYLYDVRPRYPVDSACNVCFQVEDVARSAASLRSDGCDLLVPPTRVQDDGGVVTYSVVRSVLGNVCHTLLDTSRHRGPFLPGFHEVEDERATRSAGPGARCSVTHFDHITYACPTRNTAEVMRWYERKFGFQRFFISRDEDADQGYVLDQDGIGLRLTAMEYWKCSETGIKLPFKDEKEPDCKFVIAESLPEQGRNQVDTFLEQHRGPGIQHIGLFTRDIVSTAETMAGAGVQFFSPPAAYYTKVGKQQEIEDAGHDPKALMQHGILLDTDLHSHGESSHVADQRYLLQVFTKPIFSEDTFFLELIERRGATGFGEGNIRALWRSVQSYMANEDQQENTLTSEMKIKQTGQH